MGDPRDEKIVGWQLGRKITNMRRVVFRCPYGYPVVIESFPIKDGKPFPTLYWLTCPHLRKEVSKLESQGYVKEFEEKLEREGKLREKMKKAHVEIIKKGQNSCQKITPSGRFFQRLEPVVSETSPN